jgi:hypothetical protein
LPRRGLGWCIAADATADDFFDLFALSVGDDAHGQAGDVEPGCGGSTKVVDVHVAVAAKLFSVQGRCLLSVRIAGDRFWNAVQDPPQGVIFPSDRYCG